MQAAEDAFSNAQVSAGFVTLRGNTRPEVTAKNDRGRVSDGLTLNHMMLQLQRTPAQEQALQEFIKGLHDPTSSLFHHWITAAEFGQRYGAAPSDVSKVTGWLESQGFKVNLVYPNQMVIDFTGSASQIRQAFRTEIHSLQVNGQAHIANMSDPQIPAGLASAVAGIVSLNDFRPRKMLEPRPEYTPGNGTYPVVPADLWTIYNFNPAFAAGYSGQGQTVVVVEDTDLYSTADWSTFRSTFGLASAYPQGSLVQIHPPSSLANNCFDPGVNSDDSEAAVDVEWATAAAPSAAIELVSCSNTETNFGGFVALENLLNASETPPAIVSISYGESESVLGAAFNAYLNSLYQQAVTEGVSVFVSSGDYGAALSGPEDGINVSGFTSTPYNVSVGGTDFADTYQGTNSTYWSSTNSVNNGSALSYVPEIPWNDSCASVLYADFNRELPTYGGSGSCSRSVETFAAGSGGPSGCATGAPDLLGAVSGTCLGYPKPLWQSGLIGNPNDGVRDVPDVSLFASNGFWEHAYVVCFSDTQNKGASCANSPVTWTKLGGTSFGAPIMAAIQSLVNQASGTRWGNPNPAYYSLAATEYDSGGLTSCNSALGNKLAGSCSFNDVNQIPLLYGGTGTGGDIDLFCYGINCYLPSGVNGVLSSAPQTLSNAQAINAGSGYTSAPSCTISGGGGSGATCSATLTGLVNSVTLTNGGSGYTATPSFPVCTLTGGGGTGATCGLSLVVSGPGAGSINSAYIFSYGSGYTSAPACAISGGGGTGATCTATEELGPVVSLASGGTGYTTTPHCILGGGGGTGGTCAAYAFNTSDAYQPAFTAGPGWDFATGIGTVNASNLVNNFVSSSATVSPLSLPFPPQTPFTTSAPEAVTVTNSGTASFTILATNIGGANSSDFAKSADSCAGVTIAPTATCTVSITFTPTNTGNRNAELSFTGIAPGTGQTVALSGFGGDATATLSPVTLDFTAQPVGSSATQPVTLTNWGNFPLTLTSITFAGNNSSEFSQTNTCGSNVAPQATCTISVTFTPSTAGSASASLLVVDNAVGSPQATTLAGSGQVPVPFISQPLVPTSVAPGGPGFTLTVQGAGFVPGAAIDWNGAALATTFVSNEELTATVPAGNIASARTASLTVVNPGSRVNSNVVYCSVSSPTATVSFAPSSGSPITSLGVALAFTVGDFNGDGKLDLVVGNENEDVTIVLGNGDGTFAAPNLVVSGHMPSAIAVGDFNGDGVLDLAVANDDGTVGILLGNGDGTFTPSASLVISTDIPYAIAVGDFNGDGNLDLAVTLLVNDQVAIFLGNGDGTFTRTPLSPSTGQSPILIAVSDFNRDGKLDLVTGNEKSNNMTILLGNGDGTFTPAASPVPIPGITGLVDFGLAVGDLNKDGIPDLAVPVPTEGLMIFQGNGDGTFATPSILSTSGAGPIAVALGDFNADGFLDAAAANSTSSNVAFLLGNGDGTFRNVVWPTPTGGSPQFMATGDFNGDGRLDVITTGEPDITVLLQQPPPQLAAVSPGSLTFGNQNVGTTGTSQPVTLSNTGTAALTIASIAVSANFGETDNCGTSIAANGSCTVNVTFSPTTIGPLTGTLTVTDNSGGVSGSTQTVSLMGAGTAPNVSLSSSSVSFGNQPVGSTSTASAVTVTNSGTGPLNFTGIAVTGDFTIAAGGTTCSTNTPVAASASCVINVTFIPTASGARSGSLTLTDNAGGSPQTVSLSGTGLGPVVSLSGPMTFSALMVGSTSGAQTVTLTNTGYSKLTFSGITISAPFAIATTGTTCSQANSVAAAGTCTVAITFAPTAAGAAPGSLSFSDNAPGSPQTVALSGTGQDFAFAAPSGSSTSATVAPGSAATYTLSVGGEGGLSGPVTFACTGAPSEATCAVSPNPATAGSSATNVTVSVTTTAASVNSPRALRIPPVLPLSPGLRGLLMLASALAVMAWVVAHRNHSGVARWQLATVLLASSLLLALALAGCGGGGGGGGGPAPNPGTPAGTYTITVTGAMGSGSSALSHSVTLRLTVS
jgi:hypothetical protein